HSETRQALLDAGFVEPHLRDLSYNWYLPHPDALLEYFIEAGVRAGELLRRQTCIGTSLVPASLSGVTHVPGLTCCLCARTIPSEPYLQDPPDGLRPLVILGVRRTGGGGRA